MRNINKIANCFSIILLLGISSHSVDGQSDTYFEKVSTYSGKIALCDILGDWQSIDSLQHTICFGQIGNSLVEIDGIKHGVGNYGFHIVNDSIETNGLAINWPPYNCTLHLLEKEILKIEFWQFHSNGSTSLVYRRPINK